MEDDGTDGKAKGGFARAEALTPERRRSIAKQAAVARWGEKPVRASHKGNFKEEFGIDVECYVLDDEQKTAVISKSGIGASIGLSRRGNAFTRFVASKSIADYLGAEIREKIEKPLRFQWGSGGAREPPSEVHGYDVTMLVDVCKAILQADSDNALSPNQAGLARQARIILNASAKAGIKNLVYALAGYDATRQEVVAAFKMYVKEEARDYEKEFPDQLYSEWYRLYQLPKPEKNKPWKFKNLTVDHVYVPLARSNGKILELTRANRAKSTERWKKLHQFLEDVGVKALRTHLGQLLGIAQVSATQVEYERHVEKVFGRQLATPSIEH
jgi:hypothetical protein